MEAIISSAVSAVAAIVVCLLNNHYMQMQFQSKNEKTINDVIHSQQMHEQEVAARQQQTIAIIEYKLDDLTKEVRDHNNFARRMPVVEEQIKNITQRIEDLAKAE